MKKECRKDTRFRVLVLMILLAVALCLVLLLPDYSETLVLFLCYGAVLDIPLSLLVPLVGRLLSDEWEEETGENI